MIAMRPVLLALALAAGVAACVAPPPAHTVLEGRAERTEAGPLDVRPGDTLVVESVSGDVTVEFAGGRPASWVGVISVRELDDDDAEDLLEEAHVTVERTGDVVLVRFDAESRTHEALRTETTVRPSANLTLLVPASTPVRLTAGRGDVRVTGLRAPVTASTSVGTVRVRDVHGDLELRAGSGDVEVEAVRGARCSIATTFGNVVAEGLFERLHVTTDRGAATVRPAPGSRVAEAWQVSTGFGDVLLELPTGFGCRLDVATRRGEIDSRLTLAGATRGGGGRTLVGDLGHGGLPLVVRATTGSVSVRAQRP
jgi:hypothetical protein